MDGTLFPSFPYQILPSAFNMLNLSFEVDQERPGGGFVIFPDGVTIS